VKVTVIDTEAANLASVLAGLRAVGADPEVCQDPARVAADELVVLPGVGAFGAVAACLQATGCGDAVRARVAGGRPLLAVCLGLQVLCEGSDESPGVDGLGLVPGVLRRFEGPGLRVPQLGWNQVLPQPGSRLLRAGHAYYANSYRLEALPAGWTGATSEHGGSFVAALERGPILACQFHPELSGAWGRALLRRWLESTVTVAARGGASC
jgi:imidazole glycerol-phosphate synthase subunit HisH